MAGQWYVTHGGKTNWLISMGEPKSAAIGPMPAARLLELAASGALAASELVRMEGTDVEITVGQFMELADAGKLPNSDGNGSAGPAGSQGSGRKDDPLPDWLEEVARFESNTLTRPAPFPGWVKDFQQNETLGPSFPQRSPAIPLDWLEDIREIEESLRIPPPSPSDAQPTAKSPVQAPAVHSPTALVPQKITPSEPAVLPPPATPPLPVPPPSVRQVPPPQPPGAKPAPPSPEPSARPAPPPSTTTFRLPAAKTALAAPPLPAVPSPSPVGPQPSGFNPETGQVLDPAAYALWQKVEALSARVGAPALSVAEAFLEAQRRIQEWVDNEANKPLVLAGDMEVIRTCPAVLELLGRYAHYGPVMRAKLWKKVTLLVDNRKKFFQAFS
jgi:hypothetical protein